jgi:formamidopyrimidine-DNA glycosylase
VIRPQTIPLFAKQAQGAQVENANRAGKYLFLKLNHGLIEIHFRFDGQLLWFSNARQLLKQANQEKDGIHVDVAFELDSGVLGIVDPRHLARVHVWRNELECWPLRTLGVDVLSSAFTRSLLQHELAESKQSLKKFLLDQTRIAGIENIYSCEVLWHARLDPRRRPNSLKPAEAEKLYKAIVYVLRRALECCLDPAPEFGDPQWWFQGLERILRAHQREGLACRRCSNAIQRISQDGRSTYCCLHCQK